MKTNLGVTLFFVLSGFLLSYPFWKGYLTGTGFPDIKGYILKRAGRIIPGFYLAFASAILIGYVFHRPYALALRRIIAGFTFTSGFHYTTLYPTDIDAPLWSVSFEVFSYLLMPVLFYLLYRLTSRAKIFRSSMTFWIIVFIALTGVNQLVHIFLTPDELRMWYETGAIIQAKSWMPGYNPLGFFGHFMFGIFAAGISAGLSNNPALCDRLSKRGIFDTSVIIIFIVMETVLFLIPVRSYTGFYTFLQDQPYYFPVITPFLTLLVVGLVHSKKIGKMLDCRFMKFTGTISFGIYIWHFIIMNLISFTIYPSYQSRNSVTNWNLWLALNALMIVLTYITATLSYYLIEKPVLDWTHRLSKGKERCRALDIKPSTAR
jgi:peptidoglycan/LPS O-acetylase OafA/YrhL